MDTLIISVLNQKGGVGKTTISINLADSLPGKTLLIDADKQGSVQQWAKVAGAGFDVVHYPYDTLHKEIKTLSGAYRYVVIDGPPGKESVTKSILAISDIVIIPVRPSILDIWSSQDIIHLVTAAKGINKRLKSYLLVSQKATGTRLGKEARESLSGYGLTVLKTEIISRIVYADAICSGLSVQKYAPGSVAAKEIKDMVKELLRGSK